MVGVAELESAVDEKMSLVNEFFAQYGNSENVVIVEDVADLPKNISANFGGAKASFNATDGKIYFVKNRVNNKHDALSTLVHENTHFVYNQLKDNQAFTGLFAEAVNILGGESGIAYMRAALPETYRNLDDEEIVEEYMARVCERVILGQMLNKPQKGIWANIKAFFKSWVNQDDTIAENIDKSIAEIGKRIFEVSTAQIKTKNENPPKADKKDDSELNGVFGDLIKSADYPNKIFDIDEAYEYVRKNLQGKTFQSKDNYIATLGRGGIDKMNSGLARGKTNNDKLHAYTFANVGRVFSNSIQLETEADKNNNTNVKAVHKFYAPIYFERQLYAVKITVKEFNAGTGNRLYSIEGIDINNESEYRGQSRGSKNSIPADYSDSVKKFFEKLRNVNKKINSSNKTEATTAEDKPYTSKTTSQDKTLENNSKSQDRKPKKKKSQLPEKVRNGIETLTNRIGKADLNISNDYRLAEDFAEAVKIFELALPKNLPLAEFLLTKDGKQFKNASETALQLAEYLVKDKGNFKGINAILRKYSQSAEAIDSVSIPDIAGYQKPNKTALLNLAKNKHVWNYEDVRTDIYRRIDSIPEDEISVKMEVLQDFDLDDLRDQDLEFLAENGNTNAEKELEKRLRADEMADFTKTPTLRRLKEEEIFLPTPKLMKTLSDKNLWAEMTAIWRALPFHIKNKFFRASGAGNLDELAEHLGFETEGDFLANLADEFSIFAQSGYKLSDGELSAEGLDFEKQIAEVRAKYENTPMWLKAPNGQPTKLTEEQWLAVRTPNFKRWFGDWEKEAWAKAAMDFLENTNAVASLTGNEFQKAASKRKIFINALRMSKHNAHKDGIIRRAGRGLLNQTMPFDSYLAMLGEYSTGKTFEAFTTFCKNLLAKIDRASANVANETFQAQQALQRITVECYGGNFSDALKRLLKPDAKYEEFSNLRGENDMDMKQPMALANVLQLYASATQENYQQNVYAHRAKKNSDVETLQKKIDEILLKFPDRISKHGEEWEKAKEKIDAFEAEIKSLQKNATSDYVARLEKVLTPADKKFVELLRQQYADALPALSAVSRRVIGLPIEQADVLYMPVKVKRAKSFGESVGQVPVIPKVLSPRVPHLRDFDETANPISLFLDRVRENAQFKYFSELYIEMRSIFGNEELQDLISQRCGQNTLQGLLDFIADISSGQTRGFKDEWIQKANGLFAITALGFNLGSGVRQLLPGCFAWGTYIGTPTVLKNIATFFTPEGYAAAKEIWKSENGRRRFTIGNLQIMEEMLATPDQNKFWAFYKRHSLFFNRASDMIAISVVGQGVYRTGIESYLRQGFNIDKAREMAMADMWQIAERTQASGRMHNMAQWQRRGGDLGKAIGMFSAPPQLMFAKSLQDIRRAIALGVKTPEGRAAAWRAIKTWATVSVLVEGSYAFSGVMWNAFLKGFFEEDDDERIFKQMATGPFGGLFLFGRIIEGAGNGYSSVIPIESFKRPIKSVYDIALDVATLDIEKAPEDLDKLAKSLFPFYRDGKKVWTEREIGEKLSDVFD